MFLKDYREHDEDLQGLRALLGNFLLLPPKHWGHCVINKRHDRISESTFSTMVRASEVLFFHDCGLSKLFNIQIRAHASVWSRRSHDDRLYFWIIFWTRRLDSLTIGEKDGLFEIFFEVLYLGRRKEDLFFLYFWLLLMIFEVIELLNVLFTW